MSDWLVSDFLRSDWLGGINNDEFNWLVSDFLRFDRLRGFKKSLDWPESDILRFGWLVGVMLPPDWSTSEFLRFSSNVFSGTVVSCSGSSMRGSVSV